MIRFTLRRIAAGVVVLVIISYFSLVAQGFAMRTRYSLPAPLGEVTEQALRATIRVWEGLPRGDLGEYRPPGYEYSPPEAVPLAEVMGRYLLNSLALLLLAMALGGILGGLFGILAATARKPGVSLALILLSMIGISTPSFFLGMLLQFLEITIYKNTGLRLVPVGGFGWDSHLVLPVLVLAARPVAQVARLSYVQVCTILDQDYVRTARAKGLDKASVWRVHIIPNAASTVLTALGTSLRFSLSSLPVVESLFGWPGAGRALLDMLRTLEYHSATVLILALGSVFIVVNILLDLAYRRLTLGSANPRPD